MNKVIKGEDYCWTGIKFNTAEELIDGALKNLNKSDNRIFARLYKDYSDKKGIFYRLQISGDSIGFHSFELDLDEYEYLHREYGFKTYVTWNAVEME